MWLESRKVDQQILHFFQDFQIYDEQISEDHFFTSHQFLVLICDCLLFHCDSIQICSW